MPLPTARRVDTARIQGSGDLAQGRQPRCLDLAHDRQDVCGESIGCGAVRRVRLGGGLRGARIAKPNALCLLRRERGAGPLRDQRTFFLG